MTKIIRPGEPCGTGLNVGGTPEGGIAPRLVLPRNVLSPRNVELPCQVAGAGPLPPPVVTNVVPNNGPIAGGTAVTITGESFVAGATVIFNGSPATSVNVVNATTITCVTAAHAAGAVAVTVTNPDTQFGTKTSAFTYNAPSPPVVQSVTGQIAGAVTQIVVNNVPGGTNQLYLACVHLYTDNGTQIGRAHV